MMCVTRRGTIKMNRRLLTGHRHVILDGIRNNTDVM